MRFARPQQTKRARQKTTKEQAMNETSKDFSRIPAGACVLSVGEFEIGDNGENAKTAPVRLVARSGKPIFHWFWGNVVHDLAGMHLHKPRVTIDYVHDDKEVVGYLNRFDSTSGDLVTSGALVPFKDSDRATEIIHKMKAGVPYEASINFGGDGIKIEDVPDGMVAQVNGYQFSGPGIIVREWPLRGVAICPYGADANTESAALAGANAKTYTATAYAKPNKESDMKAEEKPVEVAAQAEAPEAVKVEKQDEVKPVETPAEAAAPAAVEATAPEGEQVTEQAQEAAPEAKPLSREEFVKIADEFGAEIAALTVRDGGDYPYAMKLAYMASEKENKTLRGRVAELEAKTKSGGQAVPVSADKPKPKLFNTGK
jgi:hypothetical protein